MKKNLLLVVVLCYLVACAQDQKEPEHDMSSLIENVMVRGNKENSGQSVIFDQNKQKAIKSNDKELSQSELDNMFRGIGPCWNVNAGGDYAEDLSVQLKVNINQNMDVIKAEIIDQARYDSEPHFRSAAEAARRALLNPRCKKLNLSPDKYEQWKSFTILFDPKDML